ncbi:MAG: hypothetical protein ACREEC_05760, partial [Thermoplasmata archaeon]
YLSLLRRARDSATRYRILLVGSGILLWFALDVVFPATNNALVLAKAVVQVVPGLMSYAAFFPPQWARRKYGVTALHGGEPEAKEATAEP